MGIREVVIGFMDDMDMIILYCIFIVNERIIIWIFVIYKDNF